MKVQTLSDYLKRTVGAYIETEADMTFTEKEIALSRYQGTTKLKKI